MSSEFIQHTLTNVIIVIEKIFENLNARELNLCSRVCKTWRDQAKREKERRNYFRWNCFLRSNITSDEDNKLWWDNVTSFLLESFIEPKCVIIFCSHCLWNILTQKPRGKKKKKTEIDTAELLGAFVPKDCILQVILTDGIIGTDANMKTVELDREEYDEGLSLIMFSSSANFQFLSLALTHQDCVSLAKYWSEANGRVPACVQSFMDRQVKMINIFCPLNGIDQEIGYSLFRIFNWPLIAGGYVNDKHVQDFFGNCGSSVQVKGCTVLALAICGQEVKVASVLIRSQVMAEVESTVQSLTRHGFPLARSFGLMYACVGRGAHVYGQQNVESAIFRKFFPKTPLLGFFGNGEVGCNFPPTESLSANRRSCQNSSLFGSTEGKASWIHRLAELRQKQEIYKSKHPPKLLHAYTTVMCLVSLP